MLGGRVTSTDLTRETLTAYFGIFKNYFPGALVQQNTPKGPSVSNPLASMEGQSATTLVNNTVEHFAARAQRSFFARLQSTIPQSAEAAAHGSYLCPTPISTASLTKVQRNTLLFCTIHYNLLSIIKKSNCMQYMSSKRKQGCCGHIPLLTQTHFRV